MLGSGGLPGWTVCGRDPLKFKGSRTLPRDAAGLPAVLVRFGEGGGVLPSLIGTGASSLGFTRLLGEGFPYNSLLPQPPVISSYHLAGFCDSDVDSCVTVRKRFASR